MARNGLSTNESNRPLEELLIGSQWILKCAMVQLQGSRPLHRRSLTTHNDGKNGNAHAARASTCLCSTYNDAAKLAACCSCCVRLPSLSRPLQCLKIIMLGTPTSSTGFGAKEVLCASQHPMHSCGYRLRSVSRFAIISPTSNM